METQKNLSYSSALFLFFTSFLFHFFFPSQALQQANKPAASFTISLIHRDSQLSPWYDPSTTKWSKQNAAIQRSLTRFSAKQNLATTSTALYFPTNSFGITSLKPSNGEYLMNISIGTPPIPFLGIMDTGSDLTWTQCQPCISCYVQPLEIFDPSQSSTYRPLPCQSEQCLSINKSERGCTTDDKCSYDFSYDDASTAVGELGIETLVLDPSQPEETTIPNVVMGCGRENNGTYQMFNGSGLVGFGGGPLSLISQLYDTIGGKFSYCLAPMDETNSISKISFGTRAIIEPGPNVSSTPLARTKDRFFYYITLKGVSVGNETMNFTRMVPNAKEGNMFVDSGTTLTEMPMEIYDNLVVYLKSFIEAKTIPDPSGSLDLCYKSEDLGLLPKITVHFRDADLELNKSGIFTSVDGGVECLAMTKANGTGIFGNLAQVNYLVGYDLEEGKVSFMPTDCAKYV